MRKPAPILRTLAALTLAAAALAPRAHATDIPVTFGSLPSAQGWTFFSGGSPLATEAGTWSLAGSVLTLNTMAYAVTGTGTSSLYQQTGVVNNFEPLVIRFRARLVQHEGDFTNAFVGGGLAFGFAQGATLWQFGITPTQIRNAPGTIVSTAYDNTQFHDYRLEWTPPSSVRFYVDNTLISTNNAGLASATNRIYFGDGTGAANSQAQITEYRFLQGAATPALPTSWGRIKALHR